MSQNNNTKGKKGCVGVLITLLVIVVALISALFFLPWKSVIETQVKAIAAEKGFRDVQLSVAAITPSQLLLKDVVVSGEAPITLKDVALDYTLAELFAGKLNNLTIKGLTFTLGDKKEEKKENPPLLLPISAEDVARLPFNVIKIDESSVDVAQAALTMHLPFTAHFEKEKKELKFETPSLSLKSGTLSADAGAGTIALKLSDETKKWEGTWALNSIVVNGVEPPLPSLEGRGKISLSAEGLRSEGGFISKDKSHRLGFTLNYPITAPDKAQLSITSFAMPWHEGTISTGPFSLPLNGKKDINFTLQIEKVSLDALMQLLTGKRASATGLVSGTVPLTIKPDGTLVVHQGKLQAEAPGTISLQEEAIPGDNEQLALVRQILKKLNYNILSVSLENDKDGKLAIRMALEGLNPDFQEGHPVKLNVQLGGDVLGFLQQNVMLLFDPKKILDNAGQK